MKSFSSKVNSGELPHPSEATSMFDPTEDISLYPNHLNLDGFVDEFINKADSVLVTGGIRVYNCMKRLLDVAKLEQPELFDYMMVLSRALGLYTIDDLVENIEEVVCGLNFEPIFVHYKGYVPDYVYDTLYDVAFLLLELIVYTLRDYHLEQSHDRKVYYRISRYSLFAILLKKYQPF